MNLGRANVSLRIDQCIVLFKHFTETVEHDDRDFNNSVLAANASGLYIDDRE